MTGGGAILIPANGFAPNFQLADIVESVPEPRVIGFAPAIWRATAAWDGPPPPIGTPVPAVQAFAICAP